MSAVLALDQLCKWFVVSRLALPERSTLRLLPFFDLDWKENRGISLSLLDGGGSSGRWLLLALTGGICAGVAAWLWREPRRDRAAGLGLVLGGALGNVADRVRYGYVVDYADVHFGGWHPFIFNLADAAITIGVVLLLATSFLSNRTESGRSV